MYVNIHMYVSIHVYREREGEAGIPYVHYECIRQIMSRTHGRKESLVSYMQPKQGRQTERRRDRETDGETKRQRQTDGRTDGRTDTQNIRANMRAFRAAECLSTWLKHTLVADAKAHTFSINTWAPVFTRQSFSLDFANARR